MSTKILRTKLFIPPHRKGLVHRQRLVDHLSQGIAGKLTLVSGPAGFGKSTLLSEWVSQSKRPVGWISLDEGDNDLNRFTLYLIKAFQNISEGFAAEAIELLYSAKPQQSEDILPYLINQIAEIKHPFSIILDDYHIIIEPRIHEVMLRIIENQPPQMHLVISTRSDPPWPLARWRARSDLSEIRLKDLRFTIDETSIFLNDMMKIPLSAGDINRLDAKTEGWVAGLQMIALSMHMQSDIPGFIQRFTGSHRFVFDYLVDEVLDGMSLEIRDFLLKTSLLDRMCAQLCDYVGDQSNSRIILDQLDQMNMFVIPLDDHRSWYRYHHLFGELLQQILNQNYPEMITELHRKAREWYQQNGLIGEAIHHGVAEMNWDQVADLVERDFLNVLEYRDLTLLAQWLESLPASIIQSRPWLSVAFSYLLMTSGSHDDAALHLRNAELSIENSSSIGSDQKQHILSYIAYIQSELSNVSGDIEQALKYARQAHQLVHPNEKLLTCKITSRLGTVLQRQGLIDEAAGIYLEGIAAGKSLRDSNTVISLYGDLMGAHCERGELQQAYNYCQNALQYIESNYQKRGRYPPGAAYIHLRLSTILRYWNDIEGSLQHAQICNEIYEKWGFQFRLNYLNLAIAFHFVGDFSRAHQNLNQAELIVKHVSFWVEEVRAIRASFWLEEGDLQAASEWASEKTWDFNGELDYKQNLLYRTLARVRLAQGQQGDQEALDEALYLLPRLVGLFESSGATMYLILCLILQALALQAKDSQELAIETLNRAITLSESGGFIQVFSREGAPMKKLLLSAVAQKGRNPYINKLLIALESSQQGAEELVQPLLYEALTKRELEVLGCLDSEMTIPEIADYLVISIGTARTHIKRIYRKLDAHSRFEAISNAKKLLLI